MMDRFVIVAANRPGVLARVALLAQRFNVNIDRLRTEPLSETALSLIDLTVEGPPTKTEILRKRIEGLIDVQHVVEISLSDDESPLMALEGS